MSFAHLNFRRSGRLRLERPRHGGARPDRRAHPRYHEDVLSPLIRKRFTDDCNSVYIRRDFNELQRADGVADAGGLPQSNLRGSS